MVRRGARTAPARGGKKKGRTPSPKGRAGKKKGRTPSPKRKGRKDRRRGRVSDYSDSDYSSRSSRSRSTSREPSPTPSQEQEELAEGIETLVDLERDLRALRTERLREENEAIKRERDAWRERAEGAAAKSGGLRRAHAPAPPARAPRSRPLVRAQADAQGGFEDEDEGADDVVDLSGAQAGDGRFATLVKRVHARAATEDQAPQACSVSHALLAENDLTDACEPALFEFVAAQRLRVLDLEGNALGPRGLEAVCRALADASGASGTRLQRLCLAGNDFGGERGAGAALGEALYNRSKEGHLQKLFEVTCTLGDDPRLARDGEVPRRMVLGRRTRGHPLADNPILPDDPAAPDAVSSMPPPPPPTKKAAPKKRPAPKKATRRGATTATAKASGDSRPLNAAAFLDKISLDDADGAPQLAALVALALRGAQITRDAVQSLARMRRLTALDLSFAFVGPRGAADLAASLVAGADPGDARAAGLTYLNLTHNGIGDAGVLALAAALDGSLRKPQPDGYYDLAVDKRARDDGDARARKLGLAARAADDGPSARDAFARARRDAREGKKPPPAKEKEKKAAAKKPPPRRGAKDRKRAGREAPAPAPAAPAAPPGPRAPSLTVLDVSANRIGQRGARALALALKRSPTLASVNVGRNDLGADACAALLKAGAQSAGLFELRGARAAGARAADVAAFARRAADRLEVTRRSAGGGGRTRTITIREDDAGDEAAPTVCDMPPDATLRYAAGAGPLVARPPEVDGEALRRAEREREREAAASAPEDAEDAADAPPPSALGRAILNAAAAVRAACGAARDGADDDFALAWSPAEVATMRRERPCLPAPPPRSAWRCVARAYAPVAGQLVVSWATCVHPAPVGFRWHLVRSRPLGGGVSDGLASGSRAGETATPDEPDAYYPRGSPWAWHAHRLDVADALPGDVLSVWAAPDGPEDLARQEAAQLVARDLTVGLAASHLAATPDASCLHDAAMLALPFHDSAPLDAFDGTGRA